MIRKHSSRTSLKGDQVRKNGKILLKRTIYTWYNIITKYTRTYTYRHTDFESVRKNIIISEYRLCGVGERIWFTAIIWYYTKVFRGVCAEYAEYLPCEPQPVLSYERSEDYPPTNIFTRVIFHVWNPLRCGLRSYTEITFKINAIKRLSWSPPHQRSTLSVSLYTHTHTHNTHIFKQLHYMTWTNVHYFFTGRR